MHTVCLILQQYLALHHVHFIFLVIVPSSPPLNVTLEDINATAIRVSWEIPPIIHHNSPLTGYVIYYSDLTDPGGEAQVTILNSAVFTSVISKLEPYTLYDVQVAALNDAGTGPRSFEVTIETPKTSQCDVGDMYMGELIQYILYVYYK